MLISYSSILKVVELHLSLYYLIPLLVTFLNTWLPPFARAPLYKLVGFKIESSAFVASNIRFFSIRKLKIGNNSMINPDVILDNRIGIVIGNNVSISRRVSIWSLGHDINSSDFRALGDKVEIGNYCVLFPNSSVMPGTILAEGTVILNGAVVKGKTEPYGIYGGVPAKLLGYRGSKELDYNPVIKSYFIR